MADPSALVYTIDLVAGCKPGVEHVDSSVAKQLKRALANLSFLCAASGEMWARPTTHSRTPAIQRPIQKIQHGGCSF